MRPSPRASRRSGSRSGRGRRRSRVAGRPPRRLRRRARSPSCRRAGRADRPRRASWRTWSWPSCAWRARRRRCCAPGRGPASRPAGGSRARRRPGRRRRGALAAFAVCGSLAAAGAALVVDLAVDLDRATRGDRGRADDRGDLAGGGAAAPPPARPRTATGRGPPPPAAPPTPISLAASGEGREADRRQRGERALHPAQRAAVLAAAVARPHVLAGAAGGLHAAVVGAQEVGADLGAVGVARLGGLDQADAGAHEQRLDGRDGDVQRDREVGVRHAVDLAHQQRGALLLGQVGDVVARAGAGRRGAGPPRPGHAAACARPRRSPRRAESAGAGDRCSGCGPRGRATRARSSRGCRCAARRTRGRRRPAARPRHPGGCRTESICRT